VVALEPGKVLMAEGNPNTQKILEYHDIEVVPIDISELKKGFGGIHCMTATLARAEI
jgi:arginine deiminase